MMCFWWHKWPKWATIEEGVIKRENGQIVGRYLVQSRTCEKCGKTERRYERTLQAV